MRNINRVEGRPNVGRNRKQELDKKCRKRISKTNNNFAVSSDISAQSPLLRNVSYCVVSATAQCQLLRILRYCAMSATAQSPLLRIVSYCAVSDIRSVHCSSHGCSTLQDR